jgi:hypothetical protein
MRRSSLPILKGTRPQVSLNLHNVACRDLVFSRAEPRNVNKVPPAPEGRLYASRCR